MALQMPFQDVLNLSGATYSPAVLSTGAAQDVSAWSQRVTVTPVNLTNLNQTVAATGAQAARLTVDVLLRGTAVLSQTYYIFNMQSVPFTDGSG